jgi:hypothetical protein
MANVCNAPQQRSAAAWCDGWSNGRFAVPPILWVRREAEAAEKR